MYLFIMQKGLYYALKFINLYIKNMMNSEISSISVKC